MKIRFSIPVKAISNNIFYSGIHGWKRQSIAESWRQMIDCILGEQNDKNLIKLKFPVDITITAFCRGRILDSDNVCAKIIIDGIKNNGWIIPDDDIRYVRKVTTQAVKSQEDSVEVIMG